MHDPVDQPRDEPSSTGADAAGQPDGVIGVTTAQLIQLERSPAIGPVTGAELSEDQLDHEQKNPCVKEQLVTPTMWR
ncbi:hypothetical protein ACQR1I_07730 [Bradyrhizobium sp. HKCCYLS2038]|uniref:hypothetical protein n=1 Tax=unclassified Bradyrhizobium TaxID=2631580 RepID=UPI003EBF3DEC